MCKFHYIVFLLWLITVWDGIAGVGKITGSESYILDFWDFVHRFVFDFLFFWLIEAMTLKIVYGSIILDSFLELRQAHY